MKWPARDATRIRFEVFGGHPSGKIILVKYPDMKRYGFTLIELMVVLALIALLLAVTVPAVSATRKRALSVQCGSNVRQLALSFGIYQQEQEAFPYGFCDLQFGKVIPPGGYAGDAAYDKQGLWWFNYLEVDPAPGSIGWCPARKWNDFQTRDNFLCGNYGVNRSVCPDSEGIKSCPFYGIPLKSSQIRTPAATFLVGDSGYSLVSWKAAVQSAEPAFENNKRLNCFYIPGLSLNQTRSELQDNSDAIRGRHPRWTVNMGFLDGHQEAREAESMKLEQGTAASLSLPLFWIP